MSKKGGQLVKVMPPLQQTKSIEDLYHAARTPAQIRDYNKEFQRRYKLGVESRERIIHINDGEKAIPMNDMGEVRDINYDWYIKEARKLVDPLISQ